MKTLFLSLTTVVILSGCSSLYNKSVQLGPAKEGTSNHALLMDIKQRAVITGVRTTTKTEGSEKKPVTTVETCAEPSPDAMSAVGQSLSVALETKPGQTLELANSMSESAAFTGLRTQSIQLLRDGWYRICEGHLNGSIGDSQYELLARRFQRYTVAILAIEQITGAVKVAPVVLTSTANAQISRDVRKLMDDLKAYQEDLATASEAKTKEEEKDEADQDKDKIKELKSEITMLESVIEEVKKAITESRGLMAATSASGNAQTGSSQSVSNDNSRSEAIKAVREITKQVLNTNDLPALCIGKMLKLGAGEILPEPWMTACKEAFKREEYQVKYSELSKGLEVEQ
ncbi:hypothetical protein [Marinobacter nauticus]|uniref:hypothetical protein n=1 Tax=Marinobacter nauticus TaxID=2743 RepID=UPI004043AAFF